MKDQKGLIKFVYIVALLLLGILIWAFLHGRSSNFTEPSLALENELTDSLSGIGINSSDIISQARRERTSGAAIWIEAYMEIKLPESVSMETLSGKVASIAKKHGCSFRSSAAAGGKTVMELSRQGRLFSRLTLDTTVKAAGKGKRGKRIAVVIDDLGYNDDLKPFLDVGIPITFAVLPHERFSKKIAAELSKRGMPYILHLPLEPEKYPQVDPGKAALLIKMSDSEIESKFLSDLASVPGVVGVSNHMGSRFSSNAGKMRVLLRLVKDKGLFYFDSYTSSSTKAGKVARELGLPFEENSIFVDLEDDPAFMRKQFEAAYRLINRYGQCAVIGHISKKSLPGVLKEAAKTFSERGVEFVYLPDLVRKTKR